MTATGGTLALLLAAGTLLASATTASAQGAQAFADWDIDGNGVLSRQEFREGMGRWGVYDKWDSDRDGLLSDEEYRAEPPADFTAAQAEAWNDSGEGDLDEEDFQMRWYDAYDADDDQTLSEAEFGRFTSEIGRRGWPH